MKLKRLHIKRIHIPHIPRRISLCNVILYNGPTLKGCFFFLPKAHCPYHSGGDSDHYGCKNRRHNEVHLRPPEQIRRQTKHLRRNIQGHKNGSVGAAAARELHRRRRRVNRRHERELRCERDNRDGDRQKRRPSSAVEEKRNPPAESVSQRRE